MEAKYFEKSQSFIKTLWIASCYFISLIASSNMASAQNTTECVIIIQGYEEGTESFASNSADALQDAMSNMPGGAKVTRLAPSKTNKSKKPATLYKSKEELLKQFEEALCKQECQNVIITFIGHGMGASGINGAPDGPKDGGMWVEHTNNSQHNDFITATEIAEIIDKCKKYVKLVDNHCYGSAMTNGVLDKLKNKNLLRIGLSSSKWNEKSFFSKPADASTQYYFFMVEFLKDYYKIIGDPNVMDQIKTKAEELKTQAEKTNAENAAKRAEIQKQIDAQNAELQKAKDKLKELEDKKKAAQEKLEKYEGLSNDIDDLNKLKDDYDQLKKDQTDLDNAKTKAMKDATDEANKAAGVVNSDKNLKQKEKDEKIAKIGKELKAKRDAIKAEYDKDSAAIKDALKQNDKARGDKSKEINGKLKGDKITTSPSDKKANDAAKEKIKKITDGLTKEIADLQTQIDAQNKKIEDINKKIEELKKALAEIKDLSTVAPVAELILHEAFKSAKANTKSSTAEEGVSPVGTDPGIKIPDKPVKRVGIGKFKVGDTESYKYWVEFYKVINEKTKECVIVGYIINLQGVPVQPISSISCKEDCSEAKFKVKNSAGGEDVIELKKNAKGEYEGKINDKKEDTRTLAYNMKSLLPGEKIGQVSFINDALGYNSLFINNDKVKPALSQKINPTNSTTLEYANDLLHISIDFDGHGYHVITANDINYNQANLYHYSLYDEKGLRIGELGFYHTYNILQGSLWLEKTNGIYPVKGRWNKYDGFFEAAANTETGIYIFEKNDFSGMVASHWHAPGYSGLHILQNNTSYLPYISMNKNDMKSNDKALHPTLSWTQNSTQLSEYEQTLLTGTRIIRTEKITKDQEVIDLPKNVYKYEDKNVKPFVEYQYSISSSMKYNMDCGFPETSFPLYSYPETYVWKTDSTQNDQPTDSSSLKKIWDNLDLASSEAKILKTSSFPWWIPGVLGTGVGVYLLLDKNDSITSGPIAINDIVDIDCGEATTFDPLLNDSGEGLIISSISGISPSLVSIQNNKLVFSNTIDNATTFSYTIKDKNGATSSASITMNLAIPVISLIDLSVSSKSGEKVNGNIFSSSICAGCEVNSVTSSNINLINWNKDGSYDVNVPVTDDVVSYVFDFAIKDICNHTGNIKLTITSLGSICDVSVSSQLVNPHCGRNDGSIALSGFDIQGYTYQWNNGLTSPTISNLNAGQYSVTLSDDMKKCHKEYTVSIQDVFQKIITSVDVGPGNCYQSGKLDINVDNASNNPLTLLVSGASGNFQFSSQNEKINIISLIKNTGFASPITGQHAITIFDATLSSNCRDSVEINIPKEDLIIQAIEDTYIVQGGSTLSENVLTNDTGVGLYISNYSTNEGGTLTMDIHGAFTFTPKPNVSGLVTYLYVATDTCNQSSTAELTFDVTGGSCNYTANFSVVPASCDASNGRITASIFPNDANLQISWSNGGQGLTLVNVQAGNYTMTIFNQSLACSQNFNVNVPEENTPYVTNSQVIQGSCQNPPDIVFDLQAPITGTLSIEVNGPGFQGNFATFDGTVHVNDFINLSPGAWTFTINDQGAGPACAQTYTFELDQYDVPMISLIQIIPPSTPSSNDGIVIIQISNGAAPFTVFANSLVFPNRFPGPNTLNGFQAGVYNIFAVDANGCMSNTLTVEIQTQVNTAITNISFLPITQVPSKPFNDIESAGDNVDFENTLASIMQMRLAINDLFVSGSIGAISSSNNRNENTPLQQSKLFSFSLGKSIRFSSSKLDLGIGKTYITGGKNQSYNYTSLHGEWTTPITKNIEFQTGVRYLFETQRFYGQQGLKIFF